MLLETEDLSEEWKEPEVAIENWTKEDPDLVGRKIPVFIPTAATTEQEEKLAEYKSSYDCINLFSNDVYVYAIVHQLRMYAIQKDQEANMIFLT